MILLLVLILLILLVFGAVPIWPYSRGWGYYPASGLIFVLIVVLILWLFSGPGW
jgi:hypothetical protein